MPQWITPPQYAVKYGLNRRTVYSWAKDGKIQSVRKGRDFFVLDPEVDLFANPHLREVHDEELFPILRGTEVASISGVSPRRLRAYCELGWITPTKINRSRRYSIKNLREVIALRNNKKRKKLVAKEKREVILAMVKKRLEQ